MSEPFIPTNEIEKQLLAAQEGRISGEEFMAQLMKSELFMPILEQASAVSNLQTSATAHPLTVEDEEQNQVVVLFTSPDRGKLFLQGYPGYSGGLLAEFTWILEKLGGGLGLSINPGLETGIDMSPEMLKQLGIQVE
ncbi:MAG: SseB family protein [Gammaproteobacteria bacterium]|nr:SseB family protein [Gammaproteobacteria bacterium]